jgi:large subunit ribosomal protein L4
MQLTVNGGEAIEVSDAVFDRPYVEDLVHQVVVAYMAGARSGTKAQKTRAEVIGGKAKPWKQKGTGRARAGTTRGPIWRGGGRAFAAKPRNFEQKVNRKMFRGAMQTILSELRRQDRINVIQSLEIAEPKTKVLLNAVDFNAKERTLIIVSEVNDNLFLAARNLPHVHVVEAYAVDPVSLVGAERVVMTADAVNKLQEWLA